MRVPVDLELSESHTDAGCPGFSKPGPSPPAVTGPLCGPVRGSHGTLQGGGGVSRGADPCEVAFAIQAHVLRQRGASWTAGREQPTLGGAALAAAEGRGCPALRSSLSGLSWPTSRWATATGTQVTRAAPPGSPHAAEVTHVPAARGLCPLFGCRRALPRPVHLPRWRGGGEAAPPRRRTELAAPACARGSGGEVREPEPSRH